MTPYSVFDSTTGQILRSGLCLPDDLDRQAGPGEWVIAEQLDDRRFYIDTRSGTPIPLPPQPTEFHSWDWAERTWRGDVAACRSAINAKINAARAERVAAPLSFAGFRFDASDAAQRNIEAWRSRLAGGIAAPADFVWRDADNIEHACNAEFLWGLSEAIATREFAIYHASWRHKAAIEALTSVDDLLSYDITTDWPI